MSSNIDIILRVKDDGSVMLQRAATNLKGLGEAAQQADAGFKKAATGSRSVVDAMQKVDAAGRQTRIGFSAAAQAAQLFGANISGLIAPAAQAADALGDIVGMVASFNPISLAVAGVGMAIGGLIMLMRQQQEAAAKALEETRKYEESLRATYEAARKAVEELAPKTDPLKPLADSIPLAIERLRELAATSDEARDKLKRLLTSQEGARVLEDRIAKLQVHMRELNDEIAKQQALIQQRTAAGIVTAEDIARLQELQGDLQDSSNMMRVYQEALAGAKTAQEELRGSLKGMGDDAVTAADKFAILIGNLNAAAALRRFGENYPDAFLRAAHAGNAMNEVEQRGIQITNDLNASQKRLAEEGLRAVEAAAKRVRDTIRSMVESALQPTSVTMEDLNAALAGKYIPKWDEFRRRVEAIATGTNIEQFGEKFQAQLAMVQGMFKNLSLDEIAAKFKDFSLFADMDMSSIKQIIDFGPIEAQVAQQVDSIIGKAKAMKAAFDDVWASLSTQKKIDLAEALGLDASAVNVEGLKSQIQGAVTDATQGVGDAATKALSSGLATAATGAATLSKNISTALAPGLEQLNKTLTPVNPLVTTFNQQLSGALTAAQGLKPALDNDKKGFDEWTNAMPAYASAIQQLIVTALEPLHNALSGIVSELEAIIKKANEAATALAGMGVGTGGGTSTNPQPTPNAPGFQRGADFIVPPGFPNDSFPMRVSSGERVIITPAQSARSTGNTFVFNVTVDSDARSQQLARRVRALAAHGVS